MRRNFLIKIFSPTEKIALTGNRITAKRYSYLLKKCGFDVSLEEKLSGIDLLSSQDVVITLHAYKSRLIINKCHQLNIPCILVLTGTDLYKIMVSGDPKQRKECNTAIQKSNAIVVLQSNAKFDLLKLLKVDEKKISVIHQSVDINESRQVFFNKKSSYRVLMVGNVREEKNYISAIEGFKLALSDIKNSSKIQITLNHIGGILDKSYMKRMVEISTNSSVQFLGEKSTHDVLSEMISCDLLLHPSTLEGGALVIMEAINAGMPILASNISCHRAILGKNYAGLFPASEGKSIAKKILMFFSLKQFRSELKQQLRCNKLAKYSMECERAQLFDLISKLT
ncbi:MAG: hypothetical protein CBC42_07750 [Betaproteobacteria bacterium TMED82]|nr:MAG: hypothetical protein CBC42_07750 [Betaproteobacteria bacterium TMED82]